MMASLNHSNGANDKYFKTLSESRQKHMIRFGRKKRGTLTREPVSVIKSLNNLLYFLLALRRLQCRNEVSSLLLLSAEADRAN